MPRAGLLDGIADERRVTIHGVDELAVRLGDEQPQHQPDMNRQQAAHGGRLPEHEHQNPREAG